MKIVDWQLKIDRPGIYRVMGLAILVAVAAVPDAAAQAPCTSDVLDRAGSMYTIGRVDQTFSFLRPCLPDGFAQRDERVEAYRLMALANINVDSLAQARVWVQQLLRADSRFRPNPQEDPPQFTDMVRDLKPPWYTWLWKGNEWYKWAGRGVLVTGVASVPFLLRRPQEPDLPTHPALPPLPSHPAQ